MPRAIRARLAALLAACVAMTPAVTPAAHATGDTGTYVSGGAAVVRANGQPVVDEGSVVCDNGDGVGVGGLCLSFGGGDAVEIADEATGPDVAFQVCIDNSGDGVCTSPDTSPLCPDQVFFSHDDAGAFFNPVGPLPTGFLSGCTGGPWKGYVVLICDGVHADGVSAHSHPAGSGTGTVTSGGEGLGTFCGGGPQPSRKPYTLGSGARYIGAGTAVARDDGTPQADEGNVVCNNGENVGVGGFCVGFGGGDSVAVFDQALDQDVAFQVCIDNSGDGACTTPDTSPTCPDRVFFSHDDNGAFFNPVGPLPTGFSPGCTGGPWNGYVVFLCQGTHVDGITPHQHEATTGTGRVTTGGEGTGTFCGGSHASPSRKHYDAGQNGGGPCRVATGSDPGVESPESTQTGAVAGGPVSVADAGSPIAEIRCTVKIGQGFNNSPNNGAQASASSGSGVGLLLPTLVSFTAPEGQPVFVCTRLVTSTGETLYYDADTDTYHPDDTTRCKATTRVGDDDTATVAGQDVAKDVTAQLVATVCPLLAPFSTSLGPVEIKPDGDVVVNGDVVLDCPPAGGGSVTGGVSAILTLP